VTALDVKVPPTAAGAVLPPPKATPKSIDAHTGFAVLEQPIALTAPSPVLADGTPLTAAGAGGTPSVDAAVATATFSYGALLYRIDALGGVDIFNGKLFTPEASFDFDYPDLKPAEFVFDAQAGVWSGIFVLSGVAVSDPTFRPTDPATFRPAYGFLTLLRIPRKPPMAPALLSASSSALGPSFGVIASGDTSPVKAALLQGTSPASDPSQADGFEVVAKDSSLVPVASVVISAAGGTPGGVTLHVFQSGSLRASLSLQPGGDVRLDSATQVTIAAPIVNVIGELHAQTIRYSPYGGGPETFL
jgi:hypothetical protein